MTEKEYRKYNNPDAIDLLGKPIKPGDTVVFNNDYRSTPRVGKVSHFTESGKVAISYEHQWNYKGAKSIQWYAYRESKKLIKISDVHKVVINRD